MTLAAITDATVQGYADRLGRTAAADRAEVDATISKYDALFTAAQGDAAKRAQLEVLLGNELRDVRTRQLAERQQELDEWNIKVQDERVTQAEAALAFMDAQHEAELAKAEEQNLDTEAMRARHREESKALEEELFQAKIDDVNTKFEELYALADAQGFSTLELQQMHGDAIARLEAQQAAQSVSTTEEKNKRILLSEKQRNAALKQAGMEMLDAIGAVWEATAGSAEEAETYHKLITGFKIGIDTASAISGMETKVEKVNEPIDVSRRKKDGPYVTVKREWQYKATCIVKRKDSDSAFISEVYEEEYTTGENLWTSKPRTMIGKVAESQCLRKAFNISGLYSPEEMPDPEPRDITPDKTETDLQRIKKLPKDIQDGFARYKLLEGKELPQADFRAAVARIMTDNNDDPELLRAFLNDKGCMSEVVKQGEEGLP